MYNYCKAARAGMDRRYINIYLLLLFIIMEAFFKRFEMYILFLKVTNNLLLNGNVFYFILLENYELILPILSNSLLSQLHRLTQKQKTILCSCICVISAYWIMATLHQNTIANLFSKSYHIWALSFKARTRYFRSQL